MYSESRLIYIHDPMCSWCWAHRPEWEKLAAALTGLVSIDYRVGGLAPDSDEPMPQEQQDAISGYWKKIHEMLGTTFNYEFWTANTPRRSTYPACRAVIAARWQNAEIDMIKALQHAYYLRALNPSDISTHVQLAKELNLEREQFERDLRSPELEKSFAEELGFAHSLPIQGFPSMVLEHRGQYYEIKLDYKDHRDGLKQVTDILST